ncbi:MAG: MurR/RpiR family transcriptional regulator [Fusobacterium sp.]
MVNFFKIDINKIELTKSDKAILNYFLENEKKIYFMTAKQIGYDLAISDTTIIRFIKKLGYSNFSQFKENILKQIEEKISTPTEKFRYNNKILKNNNFNKVFFENINFGISKTFNSNSLNLIEDIKDVLCSSEKKYIVGLKSTSGIVSFFGLRLGYLLKNVETFYSNNSELIKRIIDITSKDVLFIFAYSKYSKTYDILIEIAKKANAKIIIITDKKSSPYLFSGDIIFINDVKGNSFFNSLIVTQTFCEYLLTSISTSLDSKTEERITEINHYLNENK